jgi:solute carrier family 30 (zinc transporter), member 1
MLVMIVGCCGLASNILGLLLFHDHGHSHGGHEHGHETLDDHVHAEEGYGHGVVDDAETHAVAASGGRPIDFLPESLVSNGSPIVSNKNDAANGVHWDIPNAQDNSSRVSFESKQKPRRHSRSRSRGYTGLEDIYIHPASFRKSLIDAARSDDDNTDTEEDEEYAINDVPVVPTEETPLIASKAKSADFASANGSVRKNRRSSEMHKNHHHNKPQDSGKPGHGHGHSHGDLNMRGLFLHVMGDALGNIGVIISALIIWKTSFWWRFYADPLISLIITVIILCTAIPLCKAASRILLQATPENVNIDRLRDDIEDLDGIRSAHHIHVWQLNGTKFVASLHVQVDFDFKGEGSARYMELARSIRRCLHAYGIHSSTIQPEFCLDTSPEIADPEYSSCDEEDKAGNNQGQGSKQNTSGCGPKKPLSKQGSKTNSLRSDSNRCLLECGDECGSSKRCCPGSSTHDVAR